MGDPGRSLQQRTPTVHVDSALPHTSDPAHWAQAALDASTSEVVVLDAAGTIVAANRAWRRFARERGVPSGRTGVGVNYLDVLDDAVNAGVTQARLIAAGIRDVLHGRVRSYGTDYCLTTDDDEHWFQMDVTQIPAGGAIVCHQDITWRKNLERRLVHQATHDPLTGLPNRVLLEDRIATAVQRAQRHGTPMAVLFCDLDHFKVINDTFGHAVGDDVMIAVAHRMQEFLRASDTLGRLSGDELVVVCEDIGTEQDAVALAHRILDGFAPPIMMEGHPLPITVSIGIAVGMPHNGAEGWPDAMLRASDEAMYRAKRAGGARVDVIRVD